MLLPHLHKNIIPACRKQPERDRSEWRAHRPTRHLRGLFSEEEDIIIIIAVSISISIV